MQDYNITGGALRDTDRPIPVEVVAVIRAGMTATILAEGEKSKL